MNHAHESTISVIYHSTVLMVGFSDNVFSGSESSGRILVRLLLSGGTSATPISVIVTPSDQSPVSAQGKRCVP